MQETYQDAFLNLRSFEPRSAGSFVGWLMMLARRNLLDAIRMLTAEKRGGGRNRFDPQAGGPPAALCSQLVRSSSTPSRQAARREAGTCLRRAIARLPAAYRTVVEMYDLEGCPVERVADALGRSPGAVFMLRARAHRCLARIMGSASRYLTGRT
jgi:RNA polymerase sigma factor (sigma-70 family)